MKKKIFKTGVIAMVIILLAQLTAFAAWTVSFKTLTDKDSYTIGDKVTVTVDWTDKAQAAGFDIKYDAEKLTFESANIASSNYNSGTSGVLSVNWASLDEIDFTKMEFVFQAKTAGKTTISVENGRGFGTGDLVSADDYNYASGSKEITINAKVEQQPEPTPVTLNSISITKTPTRNTYSEGEKFETAGMEITATYSDGSKKVVTNYAVSPSVALKTTDTKVVITYTENGVTKTVEQKITVIGKANNNTNTSTPTTSNKDNTTADGKMPQTGAETVTVFVIALVAVVGIAGFIGYRKLSDI